MTTRGLEDIHAKSGGISFEARSTLASTFWCAQTMLTKPTAYEALVPVGLHLGCGIARIQTKADGIGGFSADGPAINALNCIEPISFRTALSPGRSVSCGLWLTSEQLADASGSVRQLAEPFGNQSRLSSSTVIPARIVSRLCTPIDPWFQGAARDLATEARALELLAVAMTWLTQTDASENQLVPRRQIFAARELVEARLTNPPTLAEIARTVGLNERSLTAAFRQAFGASIAAYVTARRLDLAADLLADGLSPGEAAREVGYRPAHLSVAFKLRFGVSPGRYRRH